MKRNRDGKQHISTKREKCSIMVPGMPLPTRCESRRFRAGRCAEHYADWRNARDARRIAAKTEPVIASRIGVKVSKWIPKAERRWTKHPIRLMPNPKETPAVAAD